MDTVGFARGLEQTLTDLYKRIADQPTKEAHIMPIIKIDDKEYDLDQLPDEAKTQLLALQFVDAELQRLDAQAAVLQTARVAYAKALNDALPKAPAFRAESLM